MPTSQTEASSFYLGMRRATLRTHLCQRSSTVDTVPPVSQHLPLASGTEAHLHGEALSHDDPLFKPSDFHQRRINLLQLTCTGKNHHPIVLVESIQIDQELTHEPLIPFLLLQSSQRINILDEEDTWRYLLRFLKQGLDQALTFFSTAPMLEEIVVAQRKVEILQAQNVRMKITKHFYECKHGERNERYHRFTRRRLRKDPSVIASRADEEHPMGKPS